jgi:hypothetical protein
MTDALRMAKEGGLADIFKPSSGTGVSRAAGARTRATVAPGSGTSYPGGGYGSFLKKTPSWDMSG